ITSPAWRLPEQRVLNPAKHLLRKARKLASPLLKDWQRMLLRLRTQKQSRPAKPQAEKMLRPKWLWLRSRRKVKQSKNRRKKNRNGISRAPDGAFSKHREVIYGRVGKVTWRKYRADEDSNQ